MNAGIIADPHAGDNSRRHERRPENRESQGCLPPLSRGYEWAPARVDTPGPAPGNRRPCGNSVALLPDLARCQAAPGVSSKGPIQSRLRLTTPKSRQVLYEIQFAYFRTRTK